MDPRPVAAFRIALGSLVVWDLLDRLRDFYAFYSDVAVFTPQPYPELTFAVGIVAALAMIVGFKSRLAVLCMWLAVCSIQQRARLLNDGSDAVIRVMGFWLLFANPGACWSLDARSNNPPPDRTPPFALFILQAQVMLIYLTTGLLKDGSMWRDGTAIFHVLQLESFKRDWVDVLLAQPWLCALLTRITLVTELAFTPLVFWPSQITKWIAIISAFLLHLGIFLTMKVGAFSFVMPATLLLFIPVSFKAPLPMRFVSPLLAALFSLVVLSLVYKTEWTARAVIPFKLQQTWRMFAPQPAHHNARFSASADDSGADVLMDGLKVSHSAFFTRWTKLQMVLMNVNNHSELAGLARYMCWLHPDISGLTIKLSGKPTLYPDGTPAGEDIDLPVYHQPCR